MNGEPRFSGITFRSQVARISSQPSTIMTQHCPRRRRVTTGHVEKFGRGVKGRFAQEGLISQSAALLSCERIECNRAYKREKGFGIEERLSPLALFHGALKDYITGKMARLIRPFIRRATASPVREKRGSFCGPGSHARNEHARFTISQCACVRCNYNKLAMSA